MDNLVDHIAHPFREKQRFIPIVVFLLSVVISGSGVGAPSATIIIAPLGMSLAARLRIPSLVLGVAVAFGASLGGNFLYSQGGIVGTSIIEQSIYTGLGENIMMIGFLFSLLFYSAWFCVVFLARYKKSDVILHRIHKQLEPFSKVQIKSLILLAAVLISVIIHTLCMRYFSVTSFGKAMQNLDISFLFLIGGGIASVFKLADLDTVLKKHIPLKMLILLGGMTMLMGVAIETGVIDSLAQVISKTHLPRYLFAPIIALIAGVMSCFSSSISVVLPVMFPLVPELATTFSLPSALLYSAIFVASTCAGIAPFDTGGNLLLSNCQVPSEIDKMQNDLLSLCICCIGSSVLLFFLASLMWL